MNKKIVLYTKVLRPQRKKNIRLHIKTNVHPTFITSCELLICLLRQLVNFCFDGVWSVGNQLLSVGAKKKWRKALMHVSVFHLTPQANSEQDFTSKKCESFSSFLFLLTSLLEHETEEYSTQQKKKLNIHFPKASKRTYNLFLHFFKP